MQPTYLFSNQEIEKGHYFGYLREILTKSSDSCFLPAEGNIIQLHLMKKAQKYRVDWKRLIIDDYFFENYKVETL